MSEIKVNLENLKDDEREQLLALTERANKKPKRFKPEYRQHYWFVDSCGDIALTAYYYSRMDLGRYSLNNCFETKEEAEFEAEKRKVVAELEIFAIENNDEIDWLNSRQYKCFLYYNRKRGILENGFSFYCQNQGDICFSSKELCEEAIQKVGEDRIKKYLFGVEE